MDGRIEKIALWGVVGLCLVGLVGCRAPVAEAPSGQTLRVLTYNIHHGQGTDGRFDYERLAEIINGLSPDIVMLQEVDRRTQRASGVDQAAKLAQMCRMHSVYGPAMPYQNGQYGQAILARFPIENMKVHSLPQLPGREPRVAVEAHVVVEDIGPLVLVGTHLCHQDENTRVQQTQRLADLLPQRGGPPIVLAGDFNSRPGSEPMNVLLDNGWIDTITPHSKIDYILVRASDPWQVQEVTILDEPVASDHDPVLAVLQW